MRASKLLTVLLLTLATACLPLQTAAQVRETSRLATSLIEEGRPVSLEAVLYKPNGPPPYPLVLFNHGSTGTGENPASFKQTWAPAQLARFFTDRGWMVAFPQRRGRGASDGLYDEGFLPDRSRYACDASLSQPGFERAVVDIDAVYDALIKRDDVDRARVVVAGQSRGGILAIAYAGMRPGRVVGAINFVGGWMSEGCRSAKQLNMGNFERGAPFSGSTLWLYGERDKFYSLAHSRENFDRYRATGGRGEYHAFDAGPEGHWLFQFANVWGPVTDAYLKSLAR